MELTRRQALQAGALLGTAGFAGGCRQALRPLIGEDLPAQLAKPKVPDSPLVHLMNRAGFGPRPGDLQQLESQGRAAWLNQQLKGNHSEPMALVLQIRRLDVTQLNSADLRDVPYEEIIRQLQQAQLLYAVYSANQLKERMVEFWTNHFNIYIKKALGAHMKGTDESKIIRKHALGSFPELVRGSAKSPAMLAYLDNNLNQKGVPNENYARELLELHTLGVHGGYTQKDILEVARCFTGWTIETRFLRPVGSIRFDPDHHDDGAKLVLGHRIPAGQGERDVDLVLDILLKHPSTAKHLAGKLCRAFVGSLVPELQGRVAAIYAETGGQIAPMLREILTSREFESGQPMLKRPFDFIVSALRATDADTPAHFSLQTHLRSMGQPGYEWPMPDGYPVEHEAWTGSLLARWNFAFQCMSGQLRDVQPRIKTMAERFDGPEDQLLASLFFGSPSSDPALASVMRQVRQRLRSGGELALEESAALCLCSPQFQWR